MSVVERIDDDLTRQAFVALRSARRKNRIQQLDAFDAFYKAYVTGIVGAVSIYVAAGWFGDKALTASQLHRVSTDGPGWIGLLVALAVAIGLRSGGRGGPMAFERADVRHVLLAPVDRRFSIRAPALRELRHVVFIAACVGTAVGVVAARRMPQNKFEWIASGALFFVVLVALAFGVAMVSGGYRLKAWMADVLALVAFGWSGFDVFMSLKTSPLTFLSEVFLWPLSFELTAFIGLAFAVVLVVWGLSVVNRSSIEAAERRSRLVGQLRFAATLQDVRTVMVLQRQLSQEQIRQRPWIRLPRSKSLGYKKGRVQRRVFIMRSLRGMSRWPLARLFRLVLFAAVATASVYGIWAGTGALVVVAGIAMWLAALDLCEPLAQEVDHPDRLRSISQLPGAVYVQHIIVPFFVTLLLVVLGAIPIFVYGDQKIVAAMWPLIILIAAAAVGGAALAVNAKPPSEAGMVDTPETASIKFVWRVMVPPALSIVAFVPLIVAHKSWTQHHNIDLMIRATNPMITVVLSCVAFSYMVLRFSDQLRTALVSAPAQAEAAKKQREEAVAKAKPSTKSPVKPSTKSPVKPSTKSPVKPSTKSKSKSAKNSSKKGKS